MDTAVRAYSTQPVLCVVPLPPALPALRAAPLAPRCPAAAPRSLSDHPVRTGVCSVFEQRFPDAITACREQGCAAAGKDATSTSTAFPSWVMDGKAGLQGFAGSGQGGTNGPWASTAFEGGTRGGTPLVLYKKGQAGALRSVVTSPLDNFMEATIASPATGLFADAESKVSAAGVFASITHIPAGYTHPTVLVGAHGGPTPALMAWGDVLLAKTGKTRTNYANHPTDLSLTHLGYCARSGIALRSNSPMSPCCEETETAALVAVRRDGQWRLVPLSLCAP